MGWIKPRKRMNSISISLSAEDSDRVSLALAVECVEIWALMIQTRQASNKILEQWEEMIFQEITEQWGPCDFLVNRSKLQFIAYSLSNKCLNLVSGEKFSRFDGLKAFNHEISHRNIQPLNDN